VRFTTVRRLVPATVTTLVLATVSVTAGSAASAAPQAASEFCAHADLALDASILGASRSDLRAAREKLDSILEAKPPRKVTKALKRIKQSIARADLEPSAKAVAALTGAAAVVTSYVARECGDPTGRGASNAKCPLTAEQVSAALGATVELTPGACQFFPPNGASPTALFVGQVSLMCQGDYAAQLGYTEPIDGFGERAYVQRGSVARILVCGDSPFEVSAEIPGDQAASLDAAKELAELAVDS
jgi:hypothetical protein